MPGIRLTVRLWIRSGAAAIAVLGLVPASHAGLVTSALRPLPGSVVWGDVPWVFRLRPDRGCGGRVDPEAKLCDASGVETVAWELTLGTPICVRYAHTFFPLRGRATPASLQLAQGEDSQPHSALFLPRAAVSIGLGRWATRDGFELVVNDATRQDKPRHALVDAHSAIRQITANDPETKIERAEKALAEHLRTFVDRSSEAPPRRAASGWRSWMKGSRFPTGALMGRWEASRHNRSGPFLTS